MDKNKKGTKKVVKNKIVKFLSKILPGLKENLGEMEFQKRVNKATKILVKGLNKATEIKEKTTKPVIVKISSTPVLIPLVEKTNDIKPTKVSAAKAIPAKSKILKKSISSVKKVPLKKPAVTKKVIKNKTGI